MTIATSTGKGSLKPSQATMTVGDALHTSPAVDAAVRALVDEVKAASAKITGVKPPAAELRETFEGLLGRATQARGRALLYPYLGSGVGNGPLVELADGSVKWDMICGIGVNFFGHSDPELVEASVRGGIDDVLKHGNLTSNGTRTSRPAGRWRTRTPSSSACSASRCGPSRSATRPSSSRRTRRARASSPSRTASWDGR
jgi:hypothetical protein